MTSLVELAAGNWWLIAAAAGFSLFWYARNIKNRVLLVIKRGGLYERPLLRVAIGAALCFGIYFAGWNAHANVSRAGQYKAERDSALRSLALFEEAAEHAESRP
ncbi:hypothetical protein HGG76_05685 [Ochrobactrum tritici]|uniref:Uncharacterized protein n=1 Tax=Brucella tritici TaxID=94626 RepID=A0A7X6JBW5_9HYPH|nr:hypothetical protein [Brucella tritici]